MNELDKKVVVVSVCLVLLSIVWSSDLLIYGTCGLLLGYLVGKNK